MQERREGSRTGAARRAGVRTRVDRDEVFLELTRSICPVCEVVIDPELNAREGRVVLRKRCEEHGS
ncbi:MAG: hypothetical protein KatS3mg014_0774 [Actinomycetota bacterium]|nr:MAG: hypothetical protein KatS3mg014_0774 [Actinomycetota bacterium]